METKLRFSDIVRYFFVGGVTWFLILLLKKEVFCPYSSSITKLYDLISSNAANAIVAFVVMCFTGVVVQGLRMSLAYLPKLRTKEKRYKCAARWYLWILFPIYFDVYSFCAVIKNYSWSLPSWVYISDIPDKLLATLEDFVSQNTSDNIDGDMKYFNDAFSALSLVVWICFWVTLFYSIIVWKNYAGEIGILLISYLVCAGLAALFAFKHINLVGSKCLACEKSGKPIGNLYSMYGTPVAFILIRTHQRENRDNGEKLRRALESVSIQTYSNIRVIIMEDIDPEYVDYKSTASTLVEEYEKSSKFANRISYARKYCNGPAAAAFHARQMFLNIADSNDVAIMLDDDDSFRRDNSVLDIMTQMCRFNADICLSSFETIEEVDLNICNNGGKTHNNIVKSVSRKPQHINDDMCYASSIGWTKSYRYEVVEAYNKFILGNDKVGDPQKSCSDIYCDLKRYEDFPDFLTLVYCKDKKKRTGFLVTGVEEPTHSYHKNPISVTGTPNVEDFKVARAKFLALTCLRCGTRQDMFIKDSIRYVLTYIMFKEVQIWNILCKYKTKALQNEEGLHKFADIDPAAFLVWVDRALAEYKLPVDSIKDALNNVRLELDKIDISDIEDYYRSNIGKSVLRANDKDNRLSKIVYLAKQVESVVQQRLCTQE